MEWITSYERRGREQGIRELVLKLLDKKLGGLSFEIQEAITAFDITQLEKVSEKILDIRTVKDLAAVIIQIEQD